VSDVHDLRTATWVTFDGGRARSVRFRRCRLSIVAGPDEGVVREFDADSIRMGARRENDLVLRDDRVSGLHCEIRLDPSGYRLRDLGSKNGTFLGGHRIVDAYVSPGAVVSVGETKLRFDALDESVELPLHGADRFGPLLGNSPKMRELFARIARVANSDATVLITGETGTGKELVSEAIHTAGNRKDKPFVVVDCAAIPPNLIESELFGHEKGSFTGATQTVQGAFERGHGGTVFIDEIGELALNLQPKLLRVLERREVKRIGGAKSQKVDVRVLAATNRDLATEVNQGTFREDLYYRIAVARLHVPPLRERREDVPLLVDHFLSSIPGAEEQRPGPDVMDALSRHEWRGNVRELRNLVERAILMSEPFLPGTPGIPKSLARGPDEGALTVDVSIPYKEAKAALLEEFERRYITELLEKHQGNVSAAARAAGIDRMSIHKILNRRNLSRQGGEAE
jgi:DNA-binding NtrC family response regulator